MDLLEGKGKSEKFFSPSSSLQASLKSPFKLPLEALLWVRPSKSPCQRFKPPSDPLEEAFKVLPLKARLFAEMCLKKH